MALINIILVKIPPRVNENSPPNLHVEAVCLLPPLRSRPWIIEVYWVLGIATAQVGHSYRQTLHGLADLLPLGVLNSSALSTISSYGSISICLSFIVTNKDKAKYVSFYLLLANSMTAFNNRQYRRFPSIFRVEY